MVHMQEMRGFVRREVIKDEMSAMMRRQKS